jgi:hypothetical protein
MDSTVLIIFTYNVPWFSASRPILRQQSEVGQLSLSGSSLKKIFSSKKSINDLDRSSLRKMARDFFKVGETTPSIHSAVVLNET